MCRMLAVASPTEIPLTLFTEFQKLAISGKSLEALGEEHQDGWGIGGYLGNWTVHFGRSEKGAMNDSENYMNACRKNLLSRSNISMAHIRKASEGSLRVENSHPFIFNEWLFCHNGTIHDMDQLTVPEYTYEGTTDSERLFKFIVSRLDRRSARDYCTVLRDCVQEIKKKCNYTSLTFLLSNGNYLIGYRDCCEEEEYYTLYYCSNNKHTFIMCSEPLPGYEWHSLKNGELIVADKHGGIVNVF